MSPELLLNARNIALADLPKVDNKKIGLVASAVGCFSDVHFGRDGDESIAEAAEEDQGDLTPVIIEISIRTLRTGVLYEGKGIDPQTAERPGRKAHEAQVGGLHQERLTEMKKDPRWPVRQQDDGTLYMINYFADDSTPKFNIAASLTEKRISAYHGMAQAELFREEFYPSMKRGSLHDMAVIDAAGVGVYVSEEYGPMKNRTWKDSDNAYADENGNIPDPPYIYLGVNSSVFWSFLETARVATLEGDFDFAEELARRAKTLYPKVDKLFWNDRLNYFVPLIDGHDKQDEIVTSDAIDALWAKAIMPERAGAVINRLSRPDMMTAWGIRTRSIESRSAFINGARAYHNSTVWPKENSQAAKGAENYGFPGFARTVDEKNASLVATVGTRELVPVGRDGVTILEYEEEGIPASNIPQTWSVCGILARTAAAPRLSLAVA